MHGHMHGHDARSQCTVTMHGHMNVKLMNDTVKTSYNMKLSGKMFKEDEKSGIYVLRLCISHGTDVEFFWEKKNKYNPVKSNTKNGRRSKSCDVRFSPANEQNFILCPSFLHTS
jgi:hypothetical protein